MIRHISVAACLLLLVSASHAQVLFTYGGDTVTVKEFMTAYDKANKAAAAKAPVKEYLDLYIASRLKVKEAKTRGYDTLPQMRADIEGLKQQLAPNFLHDQAALNRLVQEAIERSQRNLHLAHIFIAMTADSNQAMAKAQNALAALSKGESFAAVAKKYSDDPSVAINGGDMGFITAFTLPYSLENLAYQTPVGKTSPLFRTSAGYHIFKNLEERKDPGRIRLAQILLAFPPGATDAEKQRIKKRADSIYKALTKGADFKKLVSQYSNDYISANAEGAVPEFGVGTYDPLFEKNAFALQKDGELSKPFLTNHGWHILKRLARVNSATGEDLEIEITGRVQNSDRIELIREAMISRIRSKIAVVESGIPKPLLFAYTDSVLNNQKTSGRGIDETAQLIRVGQEAGTVADWVTYARENRYKEDGSGSRPLTGVWQEFVHQLMINYYKKHLEDYDPAFKAQIEEFSNGNLFFEIMQEEIWGPSQGDTISLRKYFLENSSRYRWQKSADAILFFATDSGYVRDVISRLEKDNTNWRTISMDEQVASDSGRYEWNDIPGAGNRELKAGMITIPVISNDNTVSFAKIIRIYNEPELKTFHQAKAEVITDYQQELERKWIARLREKYPLHINQAEWDRLVKEN